MKPKLTALLILLICLPLVAGQVVPDRLTFKRIDQPTIELGVPGFGWQMDDGPSWLGIYLQNKNPGAAADGHFDNGGVPIGRSGELYIRGLQRTVITSEHQLRRDQPSYVAVMNAQGDLVDIRPGWVHGVGYPVNVTDGRVTVHPIDGKPVDKVTVKFRTDATGTITGFTGLPLRGFSAAQPPIILVAAPPLPPGQKELHLDLSSIAFARESPDGYYPAPGSVLYGMYFSGHTGRNQKQMGNAYYANLMAKVTSNDPDRPRGELWVTTAEDPAKNTGGHQYRVGVGLGLHAYGQSDPGDGNAAFHTAFLTRAHLEKVTFKVHDNLPAANQTGAAFAFAHDAKGRARPVWCDGRAWFWLSN